MIFNNYIPFENRTTVIDENGSNGVVIDSINSSIQQAVNQTQDVAPGYKKSNVVDTCNYIFSCLQQIPVIYDPIIYDENGKEIDIIQDIKLPSAFLQLGGDCKSFALFTAAILSNLGIQNGVRYASYDTDATPSHIYNFAIDEDGKEIPIDRVFCTRANNEIPYTFKQDFIMLVRRIAGDNQPVNGLLSNITNKVKDTVSAGVGVIKEIIPDKVEQVIQKGIDTAKVVGLAIPRTAFMPLVSMNVRFLATNLQKMIDAGKEKEIVNLWESLGGDYGKLKDVINIGNRKKGLFGSKENAQAAYINAFRAAGGNVQQLNSTFGKRVISGEPVTASTVAAGIAAAAPVLTAVVVLLSKNGHNTPEADPNGNGFSAANGSTDLIPPGDLVNLAGDLFKQVTGKTVADTVFGTEPKGSQAPPTGLPPQGYQQDSGYTGPTGSPEGKKDNTLLYAGLAVGGLLALKAFKIL